MAGGEVCEKDLGNFMATELRLGLPGTEEPQKPKQVAQRGSKRQLANASDECIESKISNGLEDSDHVDDNQCETLPPSKAHVVGWPPIRNFRKNHFRGRKTEAEEIPAGLYVKVGMDGAPYLRKIDLKLFEGYKELCEGLENMFTYFSIGSVYAIAYCVRR